MRLERKWIVKSALTNTDSLSGEGLVQRERTDGLKVEIERVLWGCFALVSRRIPLERERIS